MNTTLVVSISREFGSGGHVVARELSKLLDIPYYDKYMPLCLIFSP